MSSGRLLHWQFSTQAGLIISSVLKFIDYIKSTNMNRSLLYKHLGVVFKYMLVFTIEPHVIEVYAL